MYVKNVCYIIFITISLAAFLEGKSTDSKLYTLVKSQGELNSDVIIGLYDTPTMLYCASTCYKICECDIFSFKKQLGSGLFKCTVGNTQRLSSILGLIRQSQWLSSGLSTIYRVN